MVTTLPEPALVTPADLTGAGEWLIRPQLPNRSRSLWCQCLLILFPCGNRRPTLIRGKIKLGTNSENEILSDLAEPINKGLWL